jgi:hypothetical protein
MLPMMLQFIIVMVASAINDRPQRKLDYVEAERRILREQLDSTLASELRGFAIDIQGLPQPCYPSSRDWLRVGCPAARERR